MVKRIAVLVTVMILILSFWGGMTVNAENAELAGLSWQTFGGQWTFDETGFSLVGDGPSGWPKVITNTTYQHFTIEADFVGVKEGGFVFRCGEPGVGADAFDGYFVGYDSAYAYFGIDTGKWKTLNEGGPDATAAAPLAYRERMHWKLTVSGNVFSLYVDDMENPIIQTFDNTFDRAGGVGIRIRANAGEAAGRVENIVINGIPVDQVTYNEKGTYDLWAERLVAENPASQNQNKIILMGASYMEFWKNYQIDLAPYDILNFGMGGSWVRHIANKNDTMLVPYNPKAIIISSGGNDATGGASSDQIFAELQTYIDSLQRDLPGVPVIYIANSIHPFATSNLNNKNTRLRVNDQMSRWCAEQENVWYLEVNSVARAEDSTIWLADQLHMNASGYEKIAPLVLELLDEIFSQEAPEQTEPLPTLTETQPQPQPQQVPQQPKTNFVPAICLCVMAAAIIGVVVVLLGDKKKNNGKSRQ